MKTKTQVSTTAAALITLSLALTGCTINIGTGSSDDNGMMNHEMMGSGNSADYSAQDIMFAQMMIPHHQQAVDMGTLAETRVTDEAVKTLAAQIKSEQAPEIATMKGWLSSAGASTEMGHDMPMAGMLSDSELAKLESLKGAAFEKLFLESMIAHHEGAIQMARMVVDSKNTDVAKLAQAIIDSQTKQIAYMKTLLAKY